MAGMYRTCFISVNKLEFAERKGPLSLSLLNHKCTYTNTCLISVNKTRICGRGLYLYHYLILSDKSASDLISH